MPSGPLPVMDRLIDKDTIGAPNFWGAHTYWTCGTHATLCKHAKALYLTLAFRRRAGTFRETYLQMCL